MKRENFKKHRANKEKKRKKENKIKRLKAFLGLLLISLLIFSTVIIFVRISNLEHVGVYERDDFFIELKRNGTFIAQNFITIEGNYRIVPQNNSARDSSLEEVEKLVKFEIKKVEERINHVLNEGVLKGNRLTGPDGLVYTKVD